MDKSLEKFFRFFPEATVAVTNWDLGGTNCIEKKWYEWRLEELRNYNLEKRWGVYFTTCDTNNAGHKNSDFKDIRTYYCEIDLLSKEEEETLPKGKQEELREERHSEIMGKLFMHESVGLPRPSFVSESRNGFHVYWLAAHEDSAPFYKPDTNLYGHIQENISRRLGGDGRAKKLVQLLRVPGFWNNKKGGKHAVRIIPELNHSDSNEFKHYCDDEWIKLFGKPVERTSDKRRNKFKEALKNTKKVKSGTKDVFEYASNMAQEEALMAFNGSEHVGGETYELIPTAKGYNIRINGGAGTSCFIHTGDNTLMGSDTGSKYNGPTIIQWVQYCYENYHGVELGKKALAEVLKQVLWK